MSKQLIIFPFGGNAREALLTVLEINRNKKTWDVLGFVDDVESTWGKEQCGFKVLGQCGIIKKYPKAKILAVQGSAKNYGRRKAIIEELKIEPDRFATIIHPGVMLSPDAKIGYNTLIMPFGVVSCGVKIGNHCVILSQTTISHDSSIGDYCCLGNQVIVSGQVRIENNCYIASGASLKDHVTIGEGSLVGIGSNVIEDVKPHQVVAGNPARVIHQLERQAKIVSPV